jgi:hypothetical protein
MPSHDDDKRYAVPRAWASLSAQVKVEGTVTGRTHGETDMFAIDADTMRQLRKLQADLHGGTDRERDYGHKLYLYLNRAERFNQEDL